VESRVELLFDVERSAIFSHEQLAGIFLKLKNKIDSKGILHITSQSSRSQWENKEIALEEFVRLLKSSLKPTKKRISTKLSKVTKEKRLKKKKIHSEKKRMRSNINLE
jgi:ribosome-associated protein